MNESFFVAITRKVKAGKEREFEVAIAEFFRESFKSQGVAGVHLIRPLASDSPGEYGILRSFYSEADEAAFYESSVFQQWLITVAPLVEGTSKRQVVKGLEGWLALSGKEPSPPGWKVVVTTWAGVWMAVLLVSTLLGKRLSAIPPVLGMGVETLLVVMLLHWVVMPRLNQWLSRWLHSSVDE